MRETRRFFAKWYLALLLLVLSLALGGKPAVEHLFPHEPLRHSWPLPLFFLLFYSAYLGGVQLLAGLQRQPVWPKYFLSTKAVKLVLALLLFVGYIVAAGQGMLPFAVLFLLYFFVLLVYESLFVQAFEKWLKKTKAAAPSTSPSTTTDNPQETPRRNG